MAEARRQNRMKRIIKMLKSADPPVIERKFVSIASYNIGVSVKKIREYLDVLEGMGVVQYDEGELKWLDLYAQNAGMIG